MENNHAQVAVVGAGHAGIEAALAAARMGLDVVLFTLNLDAVANMPCNPSIGGTAKGHLVYEIDALGGEMGRAADEVTLQSRTLNLGKGAAVRSKRVQADRIAYRTRMKHTLEKQENLRLIQAEIVDLEVTDGRVSALVTRLGERWEVGCAIIAAGTYLDGRIHVGDVSYEGGPDGMLPAKGLGAALAREGIALRRFKTGTPARINRRSIDFSRLERQDGEEDPVPYSSETPADYLAGVEQTPCYTVYTTPDTHALIRENIGRSAMYSGKIHGTGPRYCPSIEDKIVRFADKSRHQLFAEPCGRDTEEIYLQGFSTSMPVDLQVQMVRSLPGFERAEIMRYAYAIEYDCADPTELLPTLECKAIGGLYGAGQFNGTSGYEEAAAQGLVAGINAALKLLGREPMILTRDSSYIGTLIDDLVTKGTNEPYRMMTSRSEYRLLLRQDNADVRLSPVGYRVGLLSETRYRRFLEKRKTVEDEKARLESVILPPSDKVNATLSSLGSAEIAGGIRLSDLLRRPELTYADLAPLDPDRPTLSAAVATTVQTEIKYDGYIKREIAEAERFAKLENKPLPPDVDYRTVRGLRIEAAEKLNRVRPLSVGQASRISGVNPADVSVLLIWLSSRRRQAAQTGKRGE
ncbi:MAG: tRNA uridine-5-carboxymethylaminomethyl(34) synthesis enzyme MnmG [Clostridia bacterium]|nr:tRNA uridine-5-carboxymethylaminomethyl(34) synthesis enzyme MnmG [Clostridia bacterium]